jgi:predicted phosphodiesterase
MIAPVRSAVISDLHLGTLTGNDLLRRAPMRQRLFDATRDVDQLVLLGDLLELREAPVGHTLAAAYDFADHVNEAFAGRRVVIAAGNHDHGLVAQWLDGRRLRPDPKRLPVESCVKAPRSGPLGSLVRRMGDCDVYLAYPGLRLRDDVYATHGHYLDLHMSVPTLETIAVSAIARMEGHDPDELEGPDDYEAVLEPLYSLVYAAVQGRRSRARAIASGSSARMWGRMYPGDAGPASRLRGLALRRGLLPGAIAVLNAAGLGPFGSDLSGRELRRAGVSAMCRVVERLGIEADWVVFGHTHRAGPLAPEGDWRCSTGARLLNPGSWTYSPQLVRERGRESPYWPGKMVRVDEEGPPRLVDVLGELREADLAQAPTAAG